MAKNEGWASDDDANDLLAGILDETEEEAAAEQRRIEAEIKAKEEEERRLKEEEEERRRAEAKARITAEMDRQGDLEKRRTLRMEALRIEDLKAKGEWVDPAIEEAKKAAELKAQQEEAARQAALHAQQNAPSPEQQAAARAAQVQEAPEPPKSKTLGIVLGVVVVLVLGLGGALFAITQGSYQIDQKSYAKAVYQPKDQEVKLVTMGFTPLPKVEEKVEEEEPKRRTRRRPTRRRSRPEKKEEKKPALKLDLSGTDPFGAGF